MAKKLFKFNYDWHKAEVVFEVDLEIFTKEHALETLNFFSWDYDEEEDPIYEVMKKYALEVLRIGGDSSAWQIKDRWNQEGFGGINDEIGITLTDYSGLEYSPDDLEMEVKDV